MSRILVNNNDCSDTFSAITLLQFEGSNGLTGAFEINESTGEVTEVSDMWFDVISEYDTIEDFTAEYEFVDGSDADTALYRQCFYAWRDCQPATLYPTLNKVTFFNLP